MRLLKLTVVDCRCGCGHEFEEFIHDTDERPECPECGEHAIPQLQKIHPHDRYAASSTWTVK